MPRHWLIVTESYHKRPRNHEMSPQIRIAVKQPTAEKLRRPLSRKAAAPLILILMLFGGPVSRVLRADEAAAATNARPPANEREMRFWLQNMSWYHHFTLAEMMAATGLSRQTITAALKRWDIRPETRPKRPADAGLLVIPYPGGRHPRIGFREGAVRPQRETKASIFTPWDDASYVVLDVPEAIWSSDGLLYLAHTHIDTIWDKQGIKLKPLEWQRHENGRLNLTRTLPSGVEFTSRLRPDGDVLWMEMTLANHSHEGLSDLRVQNCVMLAGCKGFTAQTNDNKVFRRPYAAGSNVRGDRWVIVAWEPCHRAWGNARCPCLHSDPKFPDCPPGESRRVFGRLSFYEGTNLDAELDRIDATGWRQARGH